MRFPKVATIFRKEILDLLRDKRTVYGMVVLPILIYPVMLILFSQVVASQTEKLMRKKYTVVVEGAKNSEELVDRFRKDQEGLWEVQESASEAERTEADGKLLEGTVQVVMDIPKGFGEAIRGETSADVTLRYNRAKDESTFAVRRARDTVETYSAEILKQRISGKPEGFETPVKVAEKDVAPPERAAGFHLGRLLAMMLVLMAAVSAFYPAIDMASGEKERGTMETLLVSPALRSEIVFGKFLAVATIAMATAILHLTSMGVTFTYFFKSAIGAAAANSGLAFSLSPANALLVLLPLVPLTLLFSALCLGLSAFARSYKEAMVYLTPVMIVANVTAFSALVPGIEFNYFIALLPIQNCAMLTVTLLSGDWKWGHVAATFASSSLYAFVALRWTWSIFQREDVLLRSGADFDWKQYLKTWGTNRAGIGSALVAVIAMMALTLAAGPSLQALPPHRMMLVHQVFLIALPAALVAVVASLNFRKTFRLRPANPVHLALAPVIAVSALVLVTLLSAWLLKHFPYFRTSGAKHEEALRETMKQLGSFPSLIAFMAILPALCEEFLFRGIVLSGLRRDLGKVLGIFGCGLLFGIAHQAPLAIITVGLFGMMLSWMALRSGSLLVTVLTHAFWNSILIAVGTGKLPAWLFPNDEYPHPAVIVLAALLLPAALWAFHRARGSDEDELAGDGGGAASGS